MKTLDMNAVLGVRVAVIGAGHAGVEAAFALAKAGCAVTLFSNEAGLPYFRPRLIAVAFGQAEAEAIAIKPAAAYAEAGIALRHEAVTALDVGARTVNGEAFGGIVIAQGARPFVPPFKGEGVGRVRTLWDREQALALRAVSTPGARLTVIGGGVLGLESALRAAMAGLRVTVVEVAPHLLGGRLGEAGEAELRAQFAAKGIDLRVGVGVASIGAQSITLADGAEIADEVVLCSAGARPNPPAGLPPEDATLALAPGVYAAGDVAQASTQRPVCAVRRANLMGALAAENLLAELKGEPLRTWVEPRLPLFMAVGDVKINLAP